MPDATQIQPRRHVRRHILGAPGQGQGERPRRSLLFHRRFQSFAKNKRCPRRLVIGTGGTVGAQAFDNREDPGRLRGKAGVIADVEGTSRNKMFRGRRGEFQQTVRTTLHGSKSPQCREQDV